MQSSDPETPSIHLVGAGVVNRSIAVDHLLNGVAVRLIDADSGAVLGAERSIAELIPTASLINDGLTLDCFPMDHLHGEGIAVPDAEDRRIVIESIPERLELKEQIFNELIKSQPADAILCTNTSTLSIDRIAGSLSDSSRFCGLHFFMPVPERPAVEIIAHERTDPELIGALKQHAKRLGKNAILCRDSPGFVVNRMLSPYLNEALDLLCQDIAPDRIEAAAERYGMPLSPLELIDTIGAATMWNAGRAFWQAFPKRVNPNPLVARLLKDGHVGKVAGSGLYQYDSAGHRSATLAEPARKLVKRYAKKGESITDDEVLCRLAVPMFVEAWLVLATGVVKSVDSIDLAIRGGLGFGGGKDWSSWMDELSGGRIIESSEKFSETSPAMTLPEAINVELLRESPLASLRDAVTRATD